ncbi:hypothetical protein QCA50_019813 [Cerrena zonata]|uniref:Transmembrane protein n=1 Tax=Cerrena zonata TaxID=2478898 RepID=A0AAW0FD12_9APHY
MLPSTSSAVPVLQLYESRTTLIIAVWFFASSVGVISLIRRASRQAFSRVRGGARRHGTVSVHEDDLRVDDDEDNEEEEEEDDDGEDSASMEDTIVVRDQ